MDFAPALFLIIMVFTMWAIAMLIRRRMREAAVGAGESIGEAIIEARRHHGGTARGGRRSRFSRSVREGSRGRGPRMR